MTEYLWVLGVAGYPATSFLATYLPTGLGEAAIVAFRASYLVLSLIVIGRSLRGGRGRPISVLEVPALLFAILYSFRVSYDATFRGGLLRDQPADYLLFTFGVVLLPALAFRVRMTALEMQRALLRVTVSLLGVGVLGILNNISSLDSSFVRLYGNDFLNPISYGHVGVSLFAASVYVLALQGSRHTVPRWIGLAGLPLGTLTVYMAGSRGPALALIAVLFMAVIALLLRSRPVAAVVAITLVLVVGPGVIRAAEQGGSGAVTRLRSTIENLSTTSDARLTYWQEGWSDFSNHPILGSGLETSDSRRYPHNVFVEAFMATGVLGGASFAVAIMIAIVRATSVLLRYPAGGWVGLLFFQGLISALFSGAIYSNNLLWYTLVALTGSASTMARDPLVGTRYALASRVRSAARNGRHSYAEGD